MKNPGARAQHQWTTGVTAALAIAMLASSTGTTAQQVDPASKRPAFDVASVKLAAPDAVRVVTLPRRRARTGCTSRA